MRVNSDFSLTVTDTESTHDIGPNSIAFHPMTVRGLSGLVYVSNITRPEFLAAGEPGQQGSVIGYLLTDRGDLRPIPNSVRDLANRPSAVQFSPDGRFLVVASINAGASALASGSQDEIVVYRVQGDGRLSRSQIDGATSTLRGNAAGRNLPSAIGFQIVGDNYVVVTEAREFQPDGAPPAFPALQDGSVSTWQILPNGRLQAIDLDVASGVNNTGRTACWLDFSDDNTFFVSNAIEAGLASYSFDRGRIRLLDQIAAQGTGATGNTTDPAAAFGTTEGWIDLWISDDGRYLYQCYGLTGTVGVFEIDGTELTLIQEVSGNLPQNNVQGIVSVGQPAQNPSTPACAAPSSPRVSFPASRRVQLDWAPVPGAFRYVIQARLKGRSSFTSTATLSRNSALFFVSPNLDIEYRIRTLCSNGQLSDFSPIYEFSTRRNLSSTSIASSRSGDLPAFDLDLSILEDTPIDLQVSPNPFNDQITVAYAAQSETALLSIYHISGAKLYEQALPVDAATHFIPMTDLQNGVYILAVQEEGQLPIQRQIIKQ